MDSNYEAQKHLANQRLSARREQAEAERILKEGRPARMSGFKQFLSKLFRRSGRREMEQQPESPRLAITGKGRR